MKLFLSKPDSAWIKPCQSQRIWKHAFLQRGFRRASVRFTLDMTALCEEQAQILMALFGWPSTFILWKKITLMFHRRKWHRFHVTWRWVDDNSIWLSGCTVPLRANAPGLQKSVNCEWRVQLSSVCVCVCVCVCVSLWWITLSLSLPCFYTDQWANGVLERDNSFTSVHTHTHTHGRPPSGLQSVGVCKKVQVICLVTLVDFL